MDTRRSKRSQASQPAPPPVSKSKQPATRKRATRSAKPTKAQAANKRDDEASGHLHNSQSDDENNHPVSHAALVSSRRGATGDGLASPPNVTAAPRSDDDVSASQRNAQKEEEEAERLEVLEMTLPELSEAAEGLAGCLRQPDTRSKISQRLFTMKRNILYVLIEAVTGGPQFINQVPVGSTVETLQGTRSKIVGRVNLVSAMDSIHLLPQTDVVRDRIEILESLDSFFCKLAEPFGPPDPELIDLALDIRCLYFTEKLEAAKAGVRQPHINGVMRSLAQIFCQGSPTTEKDVKDALFNGPYRSLSHGESGDDTAQPYYERVQMLIRICRDDSKNHGLLKLKEEFPAKNILDEAFAWALATYDETAPRPVKGKGVAGRSAGEKSTSQRRQSGPDEFHDAIEEPGEDEDENMSQDPESQPTVRAEGPQMQSLYTGAEDLRVLQSSANPPPKRAAASHGVPEDGDDPNDPDFINDGGHFETDNRFPSSGPRPATTAAAPRESKRRRVTPPSNDASSSAAAPPAAPEVSSSALGPRQRSPEPSSVEAIQRLKEQKQIVALEKRITKIMESQPPPVSRQRVPWSDNDCAVLIELVQKVQASWVSMGKYEHLFEHPRNQQAYRDKARNLKVDFLSTDAVLPPGFDLVVLGKKEITILKSLGKNPYRRVGDVNDQGRPIDTEYMD